MHAIVVAILIPLIYSQVAGCSGSGAIGRDILKKVSKPTGPEARALSKMFPSSTLCNVHSFDPVMPSVNADKKKKKKATPGTKKPKATTKTIIMLPEGELKVSKVHE